MKNLIAGNWKLNPSNRQSATNLLSDLNSMLPASLGNAEVLVCSPSVYWGDLTASMGRVRLGAQNVYHQASGAFTGELSLSMLSDYQVQYVLIGHSERRSVFGESDTLLNLKLKATLGTEIIPILCVGETQTERDQNITKQIITDQLNNALADITIGSGGQLVIAYEPVWAIGTGNVCSNDDAQIACADIRRHIQSLYGESVSSQMRILYGGSVKAATAPDLMAQPDINGLLVGGASLDANEFAAIVSAGVVDNESHTIDMRYYTNGQKSL